MRTYLRAAFAALVMWMSLAAPASAQNTIKIAYTDPLSGPFAQVGDANLKMWSYLIDYINSKGGALGRKFELVPFDSKTQPADALLALKSATDQNMPFIIHCSGSHIAAALIEGVEKHNARNPDNRIIYINCGAVATELTNEKCSFWHFRFDLNVGQKVEVLVRSLPQATKKVYLINQDYLFGQSVQRDLRAFLKKLRPDVEIVGDELIPLGKIQDFSPYITKVKASGAQALLSGNWGPDINLLLKAGFESGANLNYYTFYAHLAGGPTTIGPAADGKVYSVMPNSENLPLHINNKEADDFIQGFHKKNPNIKFDFSSVSFRTILEFMQEAINKAGSLDATKIAYAMEGLKRKDLFGYDNEMRKDDHQILSQYIVGQFIKGVKYDSEGTGLGWKVAAVVEGKDLAQPTSCQMKRPPLK